VAEARRQLGKPYHWGAAGPDSFDCSGLTMWAWRAAGVALAHYSGAQYSATTHIPLSELQPGDLVFFYSDLSHVGIYVGGGQMIHAPQTGDVVRYASIFAEGSPIYAGRVTG
jgi:cell wall-associated NlpC family hydrolase